MLSPEVQAQLDNLSPDERFQVEEMALNAAQAMMKDLNKTQAIGDGRFLEQLLRLFELLLPIIIQIITSGGAKEGA